MPKGNKVCKQCNKNCGPRTKVCECGYIFIFSPKAADKIEPGQVISSIPDIIPEGCQSTCYNLIFTPGKNPYDKRDFCPIPLKNDDMASIKEWVEKMEDLVVTKGEEQLKYTRGAIKYFFILLFPHNSYGLEAIDMLMKPYYEEYTRKISGMVI